MSNDSNLYSTLVKNKVVSSTKDLLSGRGIQNLLLDTSVQDQVSLKAFGNHRLEINFLLEDFQD